MPETPENKPPQDLLEWLGINNAPNWKVARPLGPLLSVLLFLLFALALIATFAIIGRVVLGYMDVTLGVGGLIAALLGAPFLIWSTVLKNTTVRYQKEGHMTDRIAKAVEMLGAEKTVKKDGVEETKPNLEVRIGAILSLERIAQDSTTHDKGRDHVRVMEILCAYIRENAPASSAENHEYGDWEPLKDDPTDDERKAHLAKRDERFGAHVSEGKVRQWATTLTPPREDIAQALTIIGRRTHAQLLVEAAWPNPPSATTTWVFDTECPALPDEPSQTAMTKAEVDAYREQVAAWKKVIEGYTGYRLDLRGANLQGADMTKGRYQTARSEKTRLEGADLRQARMEGADLRQARMEGAILRQARMEGAVLTQARMEGAILGLARMEGADLMLARMEGADLGLARMEGAILRLARMEGADLTQARMEGADLWLARMEGAVLTLARMEGAILGLARMEGAILGLARMEGADLWLARMDASTSLNLATLTGAKLREVDYSNVRISAEQVNASFGDASVILPEALRPAPDHWLTWKPQYRSDDATEITFLSEYQRWLDTPAGEEFIPAPPPE
ncbi:pentapeptide repeat-containing protein [Pararhodobacter sp.]|uniref:pentapeptide repeat-containing protein n=1 Tax=Pararhodobacter sp. TaxID=2127056 RepID=UPI002AFDD40A|nr:pentapeptide repeat-containing protein [Pararhodobacter sp.]